MANLGFYPLYWQDFEFISISGVANDKLAAITAPFYNSELSVVATLDAFAAELSTSNYYLPNNYLVRLWIYVMTNVGVRRLPPALTGATAVGSLSVTAVLPPGSGVVRIRAELRGFSDFINPFLDSDGDGVYDVNDPYPDDPTRDGVPDWDDPGDPDNPVATLDPPADARLVGSEGFYQLPGDGADWLAESDPDKGLRYRSGDVVDSESTYLRRRFVGPGTLYYSAQTSSEEFYDYLRTEIASLEVDYRVQGPVAAFSGQTLWLNFSYRVDFPGYFEFAWYYQKDSSGSVGRDDAWLANVTFVPD